MAINEYWMRVYKHFTINTLFINTGIDPYQKNATRKFIDTIRLTSTLNRGT